MIRSITARLKRALLMEEHVCPSWFYFSLNNFFRKMVHDSGKLFGEYVKEGQSVLDLGCGPGFFTMGLARLVGPNGKVIAVDIQKKAIDSITKKISGTVFEKTVRPVLATAPAIPVDEKMDFIITFWMLHEVPDRKAFLEQLKSLMKRESLYLLVEPKIHVSEKRFIEEVNTAESCGLILAGSPRIAFSRAAIFRAV